MSAATRIVSFNANGIRARLHQIERIEQEHAPAVIAIQESKVVDDDFPTDEIAEIGFPHVEVYGQKGHYGVALLSKIPPSAVRLGLPWRDADQQRRLISADYTIDGTALTVLNGYFPQGESRSHPTKFPNKEAFYADVLRALGECDPNASVLLVGDMNVAPQDVDIGIGDDNVRRWLRTGKASFLPEERDWLQRLFDWGLHDTYARHLDSAGDERLFSWFDYRSRGFEREPKRGLRIDLMLASAPLIDRLAGAGIDYAIRGGEKPSDHCPIWCDFSRKG